MADKNGITWGIAPIGWRNDDIPSIGKDNTSVDSSIPLYS